MPDKENHLQDETPDIEPDDFDLFADLPEYDSDFYEEDLFRDFID